MITFKLVPVVATILLFCQSVLSATSPNCAADEYATNTACYSKWEGSTASGAYYTIAMPTGWQAADGLVIFNHGLQGYTTGWGIKDAQTILDVGLSSVFTSTPEPGPGLGPAPMVDIILAQGFAVAASSYSQTGWAVFDSHIANRELYDAFLARAASVGQGVPKPLLIMGGSLGGIVTLRDIEAGLIPDIDGALLACGALAGSENWREAFDVRMIYEAVCSDVSNGNLPRPWYEKPEILAGEIEFLQSLEACAGLTSRHAALSAASDKAAAEATWRLAKLLTSSGRAQLERLDRIMQLTNSIDEDALVTSLGYAVFEMSSLIADQSKLDGTIPFHNVGVDYGDAELNQKILRSVALPAARAKLDSSYTPTGNIGNTRILSIHTSRDGLVKLENQLTLQEFIARDAALQAQISIAVVNEDSQSHCGFTESEKIAVWDEFRTWINDGISFGPQPGADSIQTSCLASVGVNNAEFGGVADSGIAPSDAFIEDNARCRFSPGYPLGNSVMTFPRDNAASSVGANAFFAATGELHVQALRIPGDENLYDVDLLSPLPGSEIFTVKSVSTYGPASLWQHSTYYDPAQSLIYIPRIRIPDAVPADANAYNVYMRLQNANGITGLQFIDAEVAP